MTEPYNSTEDVRAWNAKAGNVCPDKPKLTNDSTAYLNHKLLTDEVEEWIEAHEENDLLETFRELCDVQVVLDGIFSMYGLAAIKEAGVKEVMRANWSKFDENGNPIRRDDGKILKGPNYTPPNLAPILEGK